VGEGGWNGGGEGEDREERKSLAHRWSPGWVWKAAVDRWLE
jgi:hypothetical protein